MTGTAYAVTLATAVACALIGGVFFAFSSFVMAALGRLPAPHGVAAMQSINVTVINPLFMGLLFGAALACIGLVVAALLGDDWETGLVAGGAALYLVGTIGVTMAGNVPLNDRLEAVEPESPEAARVWSEFLTRWTRWNKVRTVAALAAAILLTAAL